MTPRGIKNNNPGNIRHGTQTWAGEDIKSHDPAFVCFKTPEYGIRAIMKIMRTYYDKYSLITIRMIITRYAPPSENNTEAYIADIAKRSGIEADHVIDDIIPVLIPIVQVIVLHENGHAPDGSPAYWYEDSVYEKAKAMALS